MSEIKVLTKEISELIAAGEVIDRPSSVAKELPRFVKVSASKSPQYPSNISSIISITVDLPVPGSPKNTINF